MLAIAPEHVLSGASRLDLGVERGVALVMSELGGRGDASEGAAAVIGREQQRREQARQREIGPAKVERAGAVSKVHTGQFNLRLRLHYPLVVPSTGPELVGAERSYGNAWARGAFLIDDAQLHAVRNTGETKRSIVLCDIRRIDVPRLPADLMTKIQ